MVLEFYYDLASQPCRTVYFMLKFGGVDFEPHTLDLFKGEQNNPEFAKINPLHAVPTIKDGDYVLTEGMAIVRYIATKYNLPEYLYPRKDVQKQGRVDEFLHWLHFGLRKPCVELIITSVKMRTSLGPTPKLPYDAEKIKELEAGVVKALKNFDEVFLKGKPFITGEEMSVADIAGFAEVLQLQVVGYAVKNENVNKWMKRVAAKVEPYNEAPAAGHAKFKAFYENAKEQKFRKHLLDPCNQELMCLQEKSREVNLFTTRVEDEKKA